MINNGTTLFINIISMIIHNNNNNIISIIIFFLLFFYYYYYSLLITFCPKSRKTLPSANKLIGDDLQTHLLHASLACNLIFIGISCQSLATDDVNLLDVL